MSRRLVVHKAILNRHLLVMLSSAAALQFTCKYRRIYYTLDLNFLPYDKQEQNLQRDSDCGFAYTVLYYIALYTVLYYIALYTVLSYYHTPLYTALYNCHISLYTALYNC